MINLRAPDCFAPPGTPALPVHAVRPETLGGVLDSLPRQTAAYVRQSGFAAKAGTVTLLPGPQGVSGALLGMGENSDPYCYGALPFALPEGSVCALAGGVDCAQAASVGFALGAYRFDQLKSQPGRTPARLVLPAGAIHAEAIVRATWLARDLINFPANLLGPAELAEAACTELAALGAETTVIEGEALASAYPLVAMVGAASPRAPRVVIARWAPRDAASGTKLVSICGKGVCFDTGGLDLKPPAAMLRMKKDMGGAAVALALTKLLIETGFPARIELRLGCVENSVAGNAMRPQDVVRSRLGLSVQIGNTDAEGRLVLADLLAEACEASPDLLLDFATLTGAARTALGTDIAAYFCNDDGLATQIDHAARVHRDPAWRLPLWKGYNSLLESHGCDLNNVSDKPHAGAILAALFLERFVSPGMRWAHFDIYAANDSPRPGRPEGGEAQCLRLAWGLVSNLVNIPDEAA